ncbi:PREDICTED: AT-hook motif nuclear-localized protein 14-like [Brassica oleracea var. oleracea]|uniref:AT-hook motif nuclear-localized protein 14-like n=1 Tax=Brassica oleracea var. oleracea TaxID=109376 RepID=UPI0006A74BCD|nr:PREDICTED: AT-hook motif nuclear-localized protein 14-like [Brassica oleracea var. oleracea]
MEPDERHHHHHHHQEHHLTSPYYHPFHHHTPTTVSAAPSYNGNMPPPPPPNDGSSSSYHHSAPSSAVTAPIEPLLPLAVPPPEKGESKPPPEAFRLRLNPVQKINFGLFRKSGQSFTPHIVNITPGEDVAQKIILFAEQSKHELCILSASGAISDPSLSHLATGTSVSYQGQYEILSLRGSYIRGEHGGKTGGLSVCLSSSDGQIVGGGVGGLLKAAGPVQVILGTFQLERKKDGRNGVKAKQEVGISMITYMARYNYYGLMQVPQSRLTWPALLEHPFIKESLEEVEAREMHTAVVDHKAAWRLKGNGGQQRNEKCDSATPFKEASALGIVADVQSDMKSAVKVNSPSPEDFLGFPTQEAIKSSGDATLDKLENTSGTVKGAKVIGEDAKAMDLVLLSLERCTKSLSKRDKRSCLLYSVSQNNFQFGWSSRNRFR